MTESGPHTAEQADPRWEVQLGRGAADELRGMSPVARGAVSELLDALANGVPAEATLESSDPNVYMLESRSGHQVRLLVRPTERIVLVVSVKSTERSAPTATRTGTIMSAVQDLAADVRFSLRSLRRSPAFTLGVIATLAIGLGGATTIFGLVDTVFRAALPFENGDELVRIRSRSSFPGGETFAFNVTPRDYHSIADEGQAFTGVVAQQGSSLTLLGDGVPQRVSSIGVTPGWASILGIVPHLGRTFSTEEEELGAASGVALISHALWENQFGGDPTVVGQTLRFDGSSVVVVGVLGPRFAYPYAADVWTPILLDRSDWTSSDLNVVARLAPGTSLERAQADTDRVYAALKTDTPGTAPNDGFQVATSRDDFVRDDARALQSLALAVAALLALVCVNVANLFTARAAARKRESALRAALGASSGRIIRGAMVEATLLFLAGGLLGLWMVIPLGDAVSVLIPSVLRTQLDLGSIVIGPRVIGFALGASLLAGLLSGWFASGWAARGDLQTVLRSGGRGTAARAGRLRDGLVVAELALSLVLLVGAGVLADHFQRLQRADLGFDTESLYSAQVSMEGERYADEGARDGLMVALQEQLAATPGASHAGLTSVNPLCCGDWGARLKIEGLERSEDAPPISVHHRYVTPEYFSSVSIPLVRGRNFSRDDRPGSPLVVIIDEALADRFWPGQDPVGQRIGMQQEEAPWRTIVGVARSAYAEGDERPQWYLPMGQEPLGRSNETLHLMVRTSSATPLQDMRAAVATVDPTLAVFGDSSMDALRLETIAQDRVGAVVAGVFAVAGLLLAALGLYGLLAYQVELRRPELGTRIALGAGRQQVAKTVVGHTVRLFAVGLVIGTGLAYALNAALVRTLEGARLANPGLYLALVLLLGASALVATLLPARAAMQVDPARVLQGD